MERQTLMIVDDPSLNRKMLIEILGDRYNYIEAENGRQAYSLGITDYIRRPFDAFIVRRRVENTLKIHNEQKRLKILLPPRSMKEKKIMISWSEYLAML